MLTPPQLEFPLALQAVVQRETPRSHSELLQLEIPLEIRPVVPREVPPGPPSRSAWPDFESLRVLWLVMLCEPPPGRLGCAFEALVAFQLVVLRKALPSPLDRSE